MINFNAYVIELEEDTWYKVCIEDVMKTTVSVKTPIGKPIGVNCYFSCAQKYSYCMRS